MKQLCTRHRPDQCHKARLITHSYSYCGIPVAKRLVGSVRRGAFLLSDLNKEQEGWRGIDPMQPSPRCCEAQDVWREYADTSIAQRTATTKARSQQAMMQDAHGKRWPVMLLAWLVMHRPA